MKILIIGRGIPDKKNPLLGIFEYDQARALSEAGIEVIYAAVDLRSIRRFRRLGISYTRKDNISLYSIAVPVGAVGDAIIDYIGKKALRILYRKIEKGQGRPDIVHAQFLDLAVLAADLCSREKLPLVITEHSSTLHDELLSQKQMLRIKGAYSKAAKIISVSESLQTNIKNKTGFDSTVISNIVDVPEQKTVRLPGSNEFIFVSAASLLEGKGFDILLKAFSLLRRERTDCRLTIMGGGPEERNLKALTKELNISDCVSFTGQYERKQFFEKLYESDAFVLASRHETFGVVYAEALACGKPVIATKCGGPECFVTDKVGMLVPTDNARALADAMKEMISQRGIYDGRLIAEYARERFSAACIAKQLTQIYSEVIKKNHPYSL